MKMLSFCFHAAAGSAKLIINSRNAEFTNSWMDYNRFNYSTDWQYEGAVIECYQFETEGWYHIDHVKISASNMKFPNTEQILVVPPCAG